MRGLGLLLLLVASGGCSLLLGESPSDELLPDAAADAADDAPPACSQQSFNAELLADTVIADGSAENMNFNGAPNATVGDQLASVGLLRFNLENIPAGAKVLEATLMAPHAANSDLCDTDCGSCDGISRAGDVEVFIGRNDWDPATVTWTQRSPSNPWEVDGANGLTDDRLVDLGTASYMADQTLVFDFAIDGAGIVLGDQITLILDGASDGGDETLWTKLVISTLENDCGNPIPISSLVLEYCLP